MLKAIESIAKSLKQIAQKMTEEDEPEEERKVVIGFRRNEDERTDL